MPHYRNRLLCAAAAMALAFPAHGQEANTAAEDVNGGDIVVTAQKRSQSIQQVPVAISALKWLAPCLLKPLAASRDAHSKGA